MTLKELYNCCDNFHPESVIDILETTGRVAFTGNIYEAGAFMNREIEGFFIDGINSLGKIQHIVITITLGD